MADISEVKKPVNQRLRIATLRVAFLLCLPVILFARPVALDHLWLFEPMEAVGTILTVLGLLGRLWSILYIGGQKNNRVFQDGPYSMMRHPLYSFSTLGVAGFGLMLGSVVLALGLTLVFFLILSVTASREEAYLRSQFGADYDDYAARVPRMIPRLSLFQTAPQVTFNVRSLWGNLRDAFVFLGLILVARLLVAAKELELWPTFAVL